MRQARGDKGGALEAAREAQRPARSSGVSQFIADVAAWKSRLHLAQGELVGATSELERVSVGDEDPIFVREIEQIARARWLVARGEHEGALRLLADLREAAQAERRRGSEIVVLTLQALALQTKGHKERAVSTLTQALTLAEPEGYVRTFVDEGPEMVPLVSEVLMAHQRRYLERTDHPSAHYLRKLLAALERDIAASVAPTSQLPDPLSEREMEVLQLVAAGKSNRRIAQELFVTAGTVKTHIRSIYRKLDAHSRTQALVRARELNLL